MSSVTFTPTAGGDGSTVTDDSNPATGLASGGHRLRFVPALSQVVLVAQRAVDSSAAAVATGIQTALDRAATKTAAAAAAVSASLAQATNPDSPIRINPRRISADFTVGSAYNAASTGPISISDGVTVTVQDNATWAIH